MISITIPAYEMCGVGSSFLEKNLQFLRSQTFKDFEVVISDHSVSDDIKNICSSFTDLDIKYIKNQENRGSSSANLNNAILNSKYDIIKFLMQDEYIFEEDTLLDIKNAFENKNVNWVATGFYNGNLEDKRIPHYNDRIIYGKNTIGSPSIVSIRKTEDIELFNPELIWLMDCDYYKRTYNKWDHPFIIQDYKIFVNHHQNQVTNIIDNTRKEKEHVWLKTMYE